MNTTGLFFPASSTGSTVQQQPPKLLDQMRIALRARHYNRSMETAYLNWTRRFIRFQNKRHPAEMPEMEIVKVDVTLIGKSGKKTVWAKCSSHNDVAQFVGQLS